MTSPPTSLPSSPPSSPPSATPSLPSASTTSLTSSKLPIDYAVPEAVTPSLHKGRPIRSFVLRTGRTTVGQAKALEDIGPQYILPYQQNAINLEAAYASIHSSNSLNDVQTVPPAATQTIFEIGFGMGEATAHIAKLMPQALYLGCEVHPPGVGALLKRIGDEQIRNIRIIQHDAVEVLTHMLAPHSLDGVHIFFPDPWHKKRHNKRRLIQPPLVKLLASRIKPGGYLHCATDWQHYAEQILQVLSDEPTLVNTVSAKAASEKDASAEGYAPKPDYRPLTKFENRGIKLGHGVWDIVFKKLPT
jgi:tRNA (guanine-N7-)-methyltransferase